ncbi:helix-turn-helix domain-containing protein [Agromyces aureus]|uniref:HTH cro/C1-type domain-containing protein n=1 Tax=Agromyces aureus TaxID=453304 RepID=A0A191WBJ0_9MICO|nr:helix-turn-helix transcriptional regulator [Agromyces aureus]ANJ25625.1 hypothetical protein ATC03_01455 [Agromyces aureus]
MSTLIADSRRAVGWTMRDLAERLDVNTSTISRMEASERDGTIGVGTLSRALEAMGFSLHLGCDPARRGDLVALELHRAVAERIRASPGAVRARAMENIERLRAITNRDLARSWLDLWEQLVSGDIETLIDTMLEPSVLGRELRRHSPFGGTLTHEERLAAIERAIRAEPSVGTGPAEARRTRDPLRA